MHYHNQEIYIETNHWSYSDFFSFICYLCVYLVKYNFMICIGSCTYHQKEDTNQRPSCCLCITTLLPLPQSQPLGTTNLFSISKIPTSRMLYKWSHITYNILELAPPAPPAYFPGDSFSLLFISTVLVSLLSSIPMFNCTKLCIA